MTSGFFTPEGEPAVRLRVQSDSQEHDVVRVDHRQQWEDTLYRPDLEAQLGALAVRKDPVRHQSTGWAARAELGEAPLTVHTHGYHSFVQALSLQEGDYVSRGLEGEETVPDREYRAARVLRLTFRPKQRSGSEKETAAMDAATCQRVAYTLSVLFNEAFPSFFPETHALLLAGTPAAPPGDDVLGPLVPALHLEGDEVASEDEAPSCSTLRRTLTRMSASYNASSTSGPAASTCSATICTGPATRTQCRRPTRPTGSAVWTTISRF